MDYEQKQKRQKIRVIISECFMVAAVIGLVAVLLMIVSGYWVSLDFEVERQGMVAVSSVPTGADVIIDGETAWFQRTNTSKMVKSGAHTIVLKKDGYDTWSKDIEVGDGLMYRLRYPRLFPVNRKFEKVEKPEDIAEFEKKLAEAKAKEAKRKIYDEDGNIPLRFYDTDYLMTLTQNKIEIIKKYDQSLMMEASLGFVPDKVKVGYDGEFITMSWGKRIATIDMERMEVVDFEIESTNYGWLEEGVIYVVSDKNELIVYDYDGLNRREMAINVAADKPVKIIDDYLYYYIGELLVRESLIAS